MQISGIACNVELSSGATAGYSTSSANLTISLSSNTVRVYNGEGATRTIQITFLRLA